MRRTLARRLVALEGRGDDRLPPRIVVGVQNATPGLPDPTDDDVIGTELGAVLVDRLPGESIEAMLVRAESVARDRGALYGVPVHFLRYPEAMRRASRDADAEYWERPPAAPSSGATH